MRSLVLTGLLCPGGDARQCCFCIGRGWATAASGDHRPVDLRTFVVRLRGLSGAGAVGECGAKRVRLIEHMEGGPLVSSSPVSA